MDDRELLTLAAKAADIERAEDRFDCGVSLTLPDGRHKSLPRWNPLEDDGDALRLVGKLDMQVTFEHDADHVLAVADGGKLVREPYNGDYHAAARRAIVRAAAELAQERT